tara:strand:+ start:439 stop:690 length:252 start_codon:yes stop_codon:yes gene_type:complete
MKKKSQREKILEHLKLYKTITTWDSYKIYRITRLSAIIHILRQDENHTIESIPETKNGASYTIYSYKNLKLKDAEKLTIIRGH